MAVAVTEDRTFPVVNEDTDRPGPSGKHTYVYSRAAGTNSAPVLTPQAAEQVIQDHAATALESPDADQARDNEKDEPEPLGPVCDAVTGNTLFRGRMSMPTYAVRLSGREECNAEYVYRVEADTAAEAQKLLHKAMFR